MLERPKRDESKLVSHSSAVHSWFLGPKAENETLLKELLDAAFISHVDWRRRFHPGDPSPFPAGHRRTSAAVRQHAKLRADFAALLETLHDSVPFFHGRYNGHMLSEQTLASQAAYFAAMLYNPNNVSSEVAPVTTALEADVARQLAEMIGYDPARSWGHLTSGGTIANFEALWIARNVFYHPVAARLATRGLGIDISVALPDDTRASLNELDLWQLLNIRANASLDLWEKMWLAAPGQVIENALKSHSLATLGYQEYSRQLSAEFGDQLAAGVVLASGTSHYSWPKIVAALGLGTNQLRLVPVDASCRMDPDALWEQIQSLSARRVPIMACVSTCGTTEEGAVDDLQRILEVRARAEWELGVTFHVHSDACYGGYASSLTRAPDGSRHSVQEVQAVCGRGDWPTSQWMRSISALENADSLSIDPHKLGYVPYPAGAFLLKDMRGRELVATDPPYLALANAEANGHVLGRFIFEGSKPGAAAAAVWLSNKTVPLNTEGHGQIIASTMLAARTLHGLLSEADFNPFQVGLVPGPDINIVCFFLDHPSLTNPAAINVLNETIYEKLSPVADGPAPYMITRTRLSSPSYDGVIKPLLASIGKYALFNDVKSEGLTVLRATVMNPFCVTDNAQHLRGLVDAVRVAARTALKDYEAERAA